mgnify:CR=1 FL=1
MLAQAQEGAEDATPEAQTAAAAEAEAAAAAMSSAAAPEEAASSVDEDTLNLNELEISDLADEYETPYPGFPSCSDVAGAPCVSSATV